MESPIVAVVELFLRKSLRGLFPFRLDTQCLSKPRPLRPPTQITLPLLRPGEYPR